jgi:hypothetical protein
MSIRRIVCAAAILMIAASEGASADTTIITIMNSPVQTVTVDLPFIATDTSSTITIGGYQIPGFATFTDNGVFLNDTGPNLLGPSWVLVRAAEGSDTYTFSDGTSVPGLAFGAVTVGYYDTYSQTFATVVGQSYSVHFLFTEPDGTPNGYFVSTSAGAAVPEPSSFALASAAALIGLGLWSRRRNRR